jgi:hypothetical protein
MARRLTTNQEIAGSIPAVLILLLIFLFLPKGNLVLLAEEKPRSSIFFLAAQTTKLVHICICVSLYAILCAQRILCFTS